MKHGGCNNKEALWVAFLIWKRQDLSLSCGFAAPWGCCKVRLPTTQSAPRNHRQWQSRTLGAQLSPNRPVKKTIRTRTNDSFDGSNAGHKLRTRLQDPQGCVRVSCRHCCPRSSSRWWCTASGGQNKQSERVCEHVPCWVVQATKCSK